MAATTTEEKSASKKKTLSDDHREMSKEERVRKARLILAVDGNPLERKQNKKYLAKYGAPAAGGFGRRGFCPETRCTADDGKHRIAPIRDREKTDHGRWFCECVHCQLRFALFSEKMCELMNIGVQGKEE